LQALIYAHIFAHSDATLMVVETKPRLIIRRLIREGWLPIGGGSHDKFEHPDRRGALIIVPRHHEVSPGVARSIARVAGWE
jgi:predicted RNA binding protein YcfA (HicA-like mRNA interferase family)